MPQFLALVAQTSGPSRTYVGPSPENLTLVTKPNRGVADWTDYYLFPQMHEVTTTRHGSFATSQHYSVGVLCRWNGNGWAQQWLSDPQLGLLPFGHMDFETGQPVQPAANYVGASTVTEASGQTYAFGSNNIGQAPPRYGSVGNTWIAYKYVGNDRWVVAGASNGSLGGQYHRAVASYPSPNGNNVLLGEAGLDCFAKFMPANQTIVDTGQWGGSCVFDVHSDHVNNVAYAVCYYGYVYTNTNFDATPAASWVLHNSGLPGQGMDMIEYRGSRYICGKSSSGYAGLWRMQGTSGTLTYTEVVREWRVPSFSAAYVYKDRVYLGGGSKHYAGLYSASAGLYSWSPETGTQEIYPEGHLGDSVTSMAVVSGGPPLFYVNTSKEYDSPAWTPVCPVTEDETQGHMQIGPESDDPRWGSLHYSEPGDPVIKINISREPDDPKWMHVCSHAPGYEPL